MHDPSAICKWFHFSLRLLLLVAVSGCAGTQKSSRVKPFSKKATGNMWIPTLATPSSTGGKASDEQEAKLLSLLKQKHPAHYQNIAVYGSNPSGTILLYLVRPEGTYLFRKRSRESEEMLHALAFPSGQITKFIWHDDHFYLWAGTRFKLRIGVGK